MSTIFMTSIYGSDRAHWSRSAIRAWEKYCEKYPNIDLVINDRVDLDVFPGQPFHFQKFSAFRYEFPGDVAIVDVDSLPHPDAPHLFEVHSDSLGLYTWYDPGSAGKPLTNCGCSELDPENRTLEKYDILRLREIEGERCVNPENWFHVCAGLLLFKREVFEMFRCEFDEIVSRCYLNYCRDEAVFSYWISRFFRSQKIRIHRLEDRWFNMPSFTRDRRYDFGPIEDAYSVQYVHCKEDLVSQSQVWWGEGSPL